MSKKSRKRNKRLLALAGLAGAVALANRKPKQSDVSQDSGRGSGLRPTVDTAKKDTSKSDVESIAKDTNKSSGSNVRTRQKIVDSSGDTVASAGTAIANNKSKVTDILPPSQNTNMYSNVGNKNPRRVNRKDGGRMGLKSGGSARGCGIAKKGFGRAMKGKK